MADDVRQGDIFRADLGDDSGDRPAVILTRSAAISRLTNVTVAPITSSIRNLPTQVELVLPAGRRCAVSLENITTIRRSTLRTKIGSLSDDEMDDVFGAIHAVFEMPF